MSAVRVKSPEPRNEEATRLYAALSDLVRVYQFRDRDRICCHDISVTQCYALEALVRLGPRTLNELAAALSSRGSRKLQRAAFSSGRARLAVVSPGEQSFPGVRRRE